MKLKSYVVDDVDIPSAKQAEKALEWYQEHVAHFGMPIRAQHIKVRKRLEKNMNRWEVIAWDRFAIWVVWSFSTRASARVSKKAYSKWAKTKIWDRVKREFIL